MKYVWQETKKQKGANSKLMESHVLQNEAEADVMFLFSSLQASLSKEFDGPGRWRVTLLNNKHLS